MWWTSGSTGSPPRWPLRWPFAPNRLRAVHESEPTPPRSSRDRPAAASFADGARRADLGGALQRRASRAARPHPGSRAEDHRLAPTGTRRAGSNCLQRSRPRRGLPPARRRHQGGALDHAGGRVVGRQLPDRRRAAPRDPRRPAAQLLPRTAEVGRGTSRRLPAGARSGMGLHRPHRQSIRSGEPAPDGARLPGGGAADHRRALGDRDHPANPPRREPASPGGADRPPAGGAAAGRRTGRRRPGNRRRQL